MPQQTISGTMTALMNICYKCQAGCKYLQFVVAHDPFINCICWF